MPTRFAGPHLVAAVLAIASTFANAALAAPSPETPSAPVATAASTDDDAPPVGTVFARGHIALGGPHTGLKSLAVLGWEAGTDALNETDAFIFTNAPPPGTWIKTVTTNRGGLQFNLNVYFRDANGAYIDDTRCATSTSNEWCTIPPRATMGSVDAAQGRDLDVSLVVATARS